MQLKDRKMVDKRKKEEREEFKGAGFRIALTGIIFLLIILRVINKIAYPSIEIIPSDFFLLFAIVQTFFLWLYELKEKQHILYVQKKKRNFFAKLTSSRLHNYF